MTDTKVKAVNYSEAQVTELLESYDPKAEQDVRVASVKALADSLGKSNGSVVAKLSSLGVYVPKVRTTKSGAPVVPKATLVATIAGLMGKTEDEVGSLEKVTKPVLNGLIEALTPAESE